MCFVGAHYFWGLHPCDSCIHNLACKQNKYKSKYKCSAYGNTYTTKEKEEEEDGEQKLNEKNLKTLKTESRCTCHHTHTILIACIQNIRIHNHKFKRLTQKYSLCCNTNVTTT